MLYSDFNTTITFSFAAWEMEQLLAQTSGASLKFAGILIYPNQFFQVEGPGTTSVFDPRARQQRLQVT